LTEDCNEPTALLVEDEALVAMIAEDLLAALGFSSHWVQSGGEAIAALCDRTDINLAIIDVGLPDMRGDDLAIRVQTMIPGVSIILATGYDPVELGLRFTANTAVRVLGKPYSELDLRTAVASLGLTTT
jgi:CheY-like chemotaxis protein